MKVCPRCQKTYADDNLNFCLEDGSVLNQASASPPPPPSSAPSQPQSFGQPQQQGWNVQPQQPYSMQAPKKSSKAWVWVLLILGLIILVCGGGIIGAFVYVGNKAQEVANSLNGNFNTSRTNRSSNTASNTTTTTSTTTDSSRKSVETLDLNNWVPENSKYASIEFTDNELLVKNNDPKYYYVLAGTTEQKSVGADAVVTVRNVTDAPTNLGYGLVFHSMTTPLIQGYAFVIDAKKGRYRIVHHSPGKEDPVVNWTKSAAIKTGTEPNTLEARDGSGNVDLYINGQKVNTITNTYGYADGVIGIYSSSGIQVAFTDMQLRH
jgi:hypothetical protein